MAKAKITADSTEIKDGSLSIEDKDGKEVMTTDKEGNVTTIGNISFTNEHVGQISREGITINLDKVKFIVDNKEHTADDVLNILADKVVQRLRGGIKFATPSKN